MLLAVSGEIQKYQTAEGLFENQTNQDEQETCFNDSKVLSRNTNEEEKEEKEDEAIDNIQVNNKSNTRNPYKRFPKL